MLAVLMIIAAVVLPVVSFITMSLTYSYKKKFTYLTPVALTVQLHELEAAKEYAVSHAETEREIDLAEEVFTLASSKLKLKHRR